MQSTELIDNQQEMAGPVAPPSSPYLVYVYHHTHWDREWWTTFQANRIRLLDLIDDLLDAFEGDQELQNFLLDGQMILLRDYLEIRPENRDRLTALLRSGRLECGPWYVLPDEFLVSGESHIRNLWLGRRMADELGCPVAPIGYLPDMFGHIGQMPQILCGFGIDNALIWRGRGVETEDDKQEFWWAAPDGSTVLTHWFPEGYYWMPFLHFHKPERPYRDKLGRIDYSLANQARYATTNVLLLPYGGDYQGLDRALPAKMREANEHIRGMGELRWASISQYFRALRNHALDLDVVRGELRDAGPSYPRVLFGVTSARLYLKQLNFDGENWLTRYAEPLSALAWLNGGSYDASLLWKSWDLLIRNHAHDSICGCSVDQVHREMITRFDQSRQIAELIAKRAVTQLDESIDTTMLEADDQALVVHNVLPYRRSGAAAVLLERAGADPRTHQLLDEAGNEIPFQTRDVDKRVLTSDRWHHTEARFLARDVPGLGYRTYRLQPRVEPFKPGTMFFSSRRPTAHSRGSARLSDLTIDAGRLENRYLRVEVDRSDGSLIVTDKTSGHVYSGLNVFEDGGDAGDTYGFSAPLGDLVLRSSEARVHISIAEAGYVRGTVRVDLDWPLPDGLSPDRLSRSAERVVTRLSTFVHLSAGSRRVEIETEWDNRTGDHRLRALFPLGTDVASSAAEGHFAVVERPSLDDDAGNGWGEVPARTMCQQRWVSVSRDGIGLTVANRGLPEFELLRDGAGTLALTLLRAVGTISRSDLLDRDDGAGPSSPAPDAQSFGRNRAQYAIIPHAGNWRDARADREAHDYLAPMYTSGTGRHAGTRPLSGGLVELEGDGSLVFSAAKKAERDEALILRFWNAGERTRERIHVRPRPSRAQLVDLLEQLIGDPLQVDEDGTLHLDADPAQIVTVALWF